MITLGNFLKEKRTQSGLSQKDVATKLGYSTSQFVSNWERGISRPPKNAVHVLIKLYDVSLKDFKQAFLEDFKKECDRHIDFIFGEF